MTVRRHLTERLHDPGSNRVFCAPPSPPGAFWEAGMMTTWTGWPAACRPQTTVPSWFDTALVVGIVDAVGGRQGGGGARRLAEALAGVRRTSIKAGRYKAGGVDEAQRRREEEEAQSMPKIKISMIVPDILFRNML
jgi:hypothetical protein